MKMDILKNRRPAAFATVLALCLILVLAGCGVRAADIARPGTLFAVTTTGQIADMVQNIGGEFVTVHALMGAGVDPHLYVASENDVERLAEADVIFYNGNFLEAQMDDVFEQIAGSKPVLALADSMNPARMLPWGNDTKEYDPHLWFDVSLWGEAIAGVRDRLIEIDPAHADAYRANAAAYQERLAALDAYVHEQAARVPAEYRILVTAHDAFNYFGRAYGFEVRGLQGISTASEAGTSDVRDLAAFIAEKRIPAIFIESSVPVRAVEALQAAVEAHGWQVVIGGSLFSDAMGSPDTPEGTYEGMVRHNIDTIVAALLGETK